MSTTVIVPDGHTVQVHPPVALPHPAPGMIPSPVDGAKAAMDSVLPQPKKDPVKAVKKPAKKAAKSPSASDKK